MPLYLNDGTSDAPKLRVYLNTGNLAELPPESIWPGLEGAVALERLKEDGFEGFQPDETFAIPADPVLPFCGIDRVNEPGEADAVVSRYAKRGDNSLVLHVGWGIEDDAVVHSLVDAVLSASGKHRLPVFFETHRATIIQDMWRTVELTKVFPEIRFNGDFSHYYCGQEMVYGGCEMKLDFMQPIFERIGFLHGRIANSCCMQMPIESADARPRLAVGEADYLEDFKEMWRRSMTGFKNNAGPGDVLVFAPEILRPTINYARVFPDANGELKEESDRYQQALLYMDIARACFAG